VKEVYSSAGWSVGLDEGRALTQIEVGSCPNHETGFYCRSCIFRLKDLVKAAHSALDHEVEGIVSESVAKGNCPKLIALVNTTSQTAFAMRYVETHTVLFKKPILTAKGPGPGFEYPITLADYQTRSMVCDAHYIRAFRVKLLDGPGEGYIRKLWDAELTLDIDGEKVVNKARFKDILSLKELILEKKAKSILFGACLLKKYPKTLEYGKPIEISYPEGWVGYMLPNGSGIKVVLDGVPDGGGLVMIETSIDLATYTTKAEVVE